MKKDTDLRRDVLDELEWEPSLVGAVIGVTGDGSRDAHRDREKLH